MKIALMGDSITQGIGSKQINYGEYLLKGIKNSEVRNFAVTGTTIRYACEKVEEIISYHPDLLIIAYGNVDAMPRINRNARLNIFKYIPERYKGMGMLDPRALFTRKQPKRLFQKIDSYFRYKLKKILLKLQGWEQWVGIDEFYSLYCSFIKAVKPSIKEIFLLSTVTIDDFFFPHTSCEYVKYNKAIERVTQEHNLKYIDIYRLLSTYYRDDIYLPDHYHPNQYGYAIIAREIIGNLSKGDRNESLD